MELNEFIVFLDKKKDEPRHPAQDITQQPGDVRLDTCRGLSKVLRLRRHLSSFFNERIVYGVFAHHKR
jgi:hypothetical protein